MPRVEIIRSEVQRLLRSAPFRPFASTLENGDCAVIEHPKGSEEFYVISSQLRLFSTFGAVSAAALMDRGE